MSRSHVDDRRHPPGAKQAYTLILAEALPAMGSVLLAPAAPQMLRHFEALGTGPYLVMLAIAAPAACIALISPFAGALVSRVGRRRALVGALLLYGIVGVAPLFLDNLTAIIGLRFALGLTEAVILTANLSLMGDYFEDETRAKWIAIQSSAMPIFGSLFFVGGGLLSGLSWKAPFAAYALSFLVLALAVVFIHDAPLGKADEAESGSRSPMPWRALAGLCAVSVVSLLLFFIVPLQFGVLLDANAKPPPSLIGVCMAVTAVGNSIGAYVFRYVARFTTHQLLSVGFLIAGTGLLLAAPSPSIVFMTAFGFLNQVGCGIVVPTLASAALAILPAVRRSLGTSMWWSSFYAGQFLAPLVVVFAIQHAGGTDRGFGALGIGSILFGLLLGVLHWTGRAPRRQPAKA